MDLLEVFGWPESYEDDAERAVRSALDILQQGEPNTLQVSAGVATGIAYILGDNESARAGFPSGATVSDSLQLRYRAAPGSILVRASTYRYTRKAFVYEGLSVQLQAGQVETVYRPAGIAAQVQKFYGIEGLQAELVGREAELTALGSALRLTLEGQGQFVSVVGEAGLGKSRLIRDFRIQLSPSSELVWLEGRCQELNSSRAYWPILDALQGYFGLHPADEEPLRAGRILSSLSRLVEQGVMTDTEREEIGPLLGRLFSLRFGNEWDRRLKSADPEQMRHRTQRAIVALLGALSRMAPTVLLLEDLHWADNLSLDLVSLLLDELSKKQLLLICVHRPEPEHRCSSLAMAASRKIPESYTDIRLQALDVIDTRRLIESLLRAEQLPDSFLQPIFRRSRGNPFYTEEIIRASIEQGLLQREGENWRFPVEIAEQTAPRGLLVLIQRRCDRLKPETRQVLQNAAVIGELFLLLFCRKRERIS